MTAPTRRAVTYGLDADPQQVTDAANHALEGTGHAAYYLPGDGDSVVWIVERGDPTALGRWFLPGDQLVIAADGSWRIENAPAVTS